MSEPSRDAVASKFNRYHERGGRMTTDEALELFTGLDPNGQSDTIRAGVTLAAEVMRLEAELGRQQEDNYRLMRDLAALSALLDAPPETKR